MNAPEHPALATSGRQKPPLVRMADKTVALEVGMREKGPELARWLAMGTIGLGLFGMLVPRGMARLTGTRAALPWRHACAGANLALGAGLLLAEDKRRWLKGLASYDTCAVASLAAHGDKGLANRGATLVSMAGATVLALLESALATRLEIEAMHKRASRFDYSDPAGLRATAGSTPARSSQQRSQHSADGEPSVAIAGQTVVNRASSQDQ